MIYPFHNVLTPVLHSLIALGLKRMKSKDSMPLLARGRHFTCTVETESGEETER